MKKAETRKKLVETKGLVDSLLSELNGQEVVKEQEVGENGYNYYQLQP